MVLGGDVADRVSSDSELIREVPQTTPLLLRLLALQQRVLGGRGWRGGLLGCERGLAWWHSRQARNGWD